jgi:hypothetical protein
MIFSDSARKVNGIFNLGKLPVSNHLRFFGASGFSSLPKVKI